MFLFWGVGSGDGGGGVAVGGGVVGGQGRCEQRSFCEN